MHWERDAYGEQDDSNHWLAPSYDPEVMGSFFFSDMPSSLQRDNDDVNHPYIQPVSGRK